MKKIILRVLVGILVLAAGVAVYAWHTATSLEAEAVTEDVSVLFGLGGNVGVLRTERGAVVVDTMTFRMQGDRIREMAESLSGGPVQVVINTHYHSDHAHGNPGFPSGTRIVATERTRELMLELDGSYWEGDAAGTLPNELFRIDHEMEVGGKTVRTLHLGSGHTSGDLVVLFVEDRVLHTGDLFFNRLYPGIDLGGGGSVRAWIDTIDRILLLDFGVIIPGHGRPGGREDLVAFQSFLKQLWDVGETASREGWSVDETRENADLTLDAGYGEMGIPGVFWLDRDFVIGRVWEEATGNRLEE